MKWIETKIKLPLTNKAVLVWLSRNLSLSTGRFSVGDCWIFNEIALTGESMPNMWRNIELSD